MMDWGVAKVSATSLLMKARKGLPMPLVPAPLFDGPMVKSTATSYGEETPCPLVPRPASWRQS